MTLTALFGRITDSSSFNQRVIYNNALLLQFST